MTRRTLIGSALLLSFVLGTAGALAAWKQASLAENAAAAGNQPEPVEVITAVEAADSEYRPTVTSIGTVLALKSITLKNELPGTVRHVALTPGQVVDAGTVLVALDVAVERAELEALQAQAGLAESVLARSLRLREQNAISQEELDRARADRDVAAAQVARTRAIIERKTIRAPFRARVGIADVHPGQYLDAGTRLTTLQGVDGAAHIDFAVEQQVAAGLHEGDRVDVTVNGQRGIVVPATIVAIDARIDPVTRNAIVRARIDAADAAPAPGASVRVRVPNGAAIPVVSIPANALRKGPEGDHVFVVAADAAGNPRAQQRPVDVLATVGDEVVIGSGLAPGERVAAAGSFKLRQDVMVALADVSYVARSGAGR